MAGLFFCLASDTVQGFCFAQIQYSPIQAFTARFAVSMQFHPRHKTVYRALQRLFLRLHPLNRPRYKADKSGYNVTCDTLEGIHAPGRPHPIPDTTATPGRCTDQHSPPIIIRYIRRCSISQTMPARRVSILPTPGGCSLAPGQRSGRAVWHPPPGGAVQRQGHGGRRGTIGGLRRISFRAVAR